MVRKTIILVALAVWVGSAVSVHAELVGYWKLNDGTGSTVADSSGYGNHGTIMNNPTWIPGVEGSALEFHGLGRAGGGGDYINCGNDASMDITSQISIALWIRPGADDPEGDGMETAPMCKALSSASPSWSWQVRYGWNSPQPYMSFTFNTSPRAWAYVGKNLERDEWAHIACSHDGSTLKCYLDGEETDSTSMGAITSSPASVLIGSDGWGSDWIGAIDEVKLFDHGLTPEEILDAMKVRDEALAYNPIPEHEATDVTRDLILSWTPGSFAQTHDVYFGTDWQDVNDAAKTNPLGVMTSLEQSANTYDPGRLSFDTVYYWRVDEVNSPTSPGLHKGEVWSFTVESLAYPVTPIAATASSSFLPTMEATRTIDGSGLDALDQHSTDGTDMWLTSATDTERWIQYEFDKPEKLHEMLVWNSNQAVESFIGFGLKSVTIETSLDGTTWTALADVPEFAQAPGLVTYVYNTVVDFGGVTARYVKLTAINGHGTIPQFGLSEVRFLAIPVYASRPQPANGAVVEDVDVTLQWRAGREADTHEVVMSTDVAAVEAGTAVVGNPTENRFIPATLTYGTEYFWRIDEVNGVAETPRYDGGVWSFLAPEYLVIDDFEMYADEEFLEIWAFWVDGYQNDNNGAIVGNGNAGDTDVFYEGRQSMPIHFDNSGAAISEVTRTFSPLLDWSRGAPTTLSLHVRGDAPAFIDGGDTLTVGGSGADIWNAADEFRFVYKTLSGNGSITAKVESLTHVDAWAKGGVMIRESLTPESTCAYTVATGVQGVTFQYRTTAFSNSQSDSSTRNAAWADQDDEPVWVRVERNGDEFNGYMSLDGVNWTGSVSNPQAITMVSDVKIGFCVTSHDNDQSSTAVFSNVTTTGSVSGNWTVEEFGTGHPDNDAAPMYLVVADASGGTKTFVHPDANATVNTAWTPWQIPLNDMGSVNLGSIEKITIGVGTPGGSASGAQGTVYVDLLQVGTPRE